ncbi:hypothetical protein D9M69_204490 [compost metagenome]
MVKETPPQRDVTPVSIQLDRIVTRCRWHTHDFSNEVPWVEGTFNLNFKLHRIAEQWIVRVDSLKIGLHQCQHELMIFDPHGFKETCKFQERFVGRLKIPNGSRVSIPIAFEQYRFHGCPWIC